MWRETRPIWTIIRYTSLAVILVAGGALLWLYLNSLKAQPMADPVVILPTETRATHLFVPPTAWETPTPRPKQPTWTPYGNPTGTDTLAPTGTATATLSISLTPTAAATLTRTPTALMTRTKTKTPGPTTIHSPTPTYNPTLSSQFITFNPLSFTKTYGDSDITISATASSGLPISFSAGGACSNSGSTISITGAGTCTVTASQGGNASYNPAFDVARSFIVNKAAANCSVTGYNVTYTGTPHTATGSCTGVFSEPLSGLDLNNTRHTSAGDDFSSDSWSYPGDANYSSDSGSVSDNISKANGCNISGWSGAYDTSPHGATGSCQGAGTLDLGSSYTDAPGGSADWSYSGDINHNSQSATVSIIINKVNGCSISGWSGAYDTSPHGATGSCQGAGTLDLGSSYTDAPGGSADWSYSGDINHNSQGATVSIIINKINGCSISGWSGAYDTLPHGATGSCQGAGTLYLGFSYTDAPGGTADWSYSGDTNYNYQSGSVAIIIY